MFETILGAKTLEQFDPKVPRDEIIRRGRILIIDDDSPVLIDALKKAGFSVDHDEKGDDLHNVESQIYDVILLDYGGVGGSFGKDQGLCLLRHIKRTAPGTRVLAFTSKALPSDQSDFFRLADDILQKDAGLQESLEKIEGALLESFRLQNLWSAVLELSGVKPGTIDAGRLEKALVKSIQKRDISIVTKVFAKALGKALQGSAEAVLKKLCLAAGVPL